MLINLESFLESDSHLPVHGFPGMFLYLLQDLSGDQSEEVKGYAVIQCGVLLRKKISSSCMGLKSIVRTIVLDIYVEKGCFCERDWWTFEGLNTLHPDKKTHSGYQTF